MSETTDYEKMSDREIDSLIAEKIMGYVWLSRDDDSENSNPYRDAWLFPPDSFDQFTGKKGMFDEPVFERATKEQRLGIIGKFKPYDGGRKNALSWFVPYWSTDVTAWFSLVEEMRKRWNFDFEWDFDDEGDYWTVCITDWIVVDGKVIVAENHTSLFRATCIAALRWWEANGGETK